jgi:hypothetical protein
MGNSVIPLYQGSYWPEKPLLNKLGLPGLLEKNKIKKIKINT